MNFAVTQAAIKRLLESELHAPDDHAWTLQGLGMLRLYLTSDKSVRLHIWDDRFAVEGVSEMHTHPWDMRSTVIAGFVENARFVETTAGGIRGIAYHRQSIFCGEGGGLEGDPQTVELIMRAPESYLPGDSYEQTAAEIHVSRPQRGTVTIVERSFGSDVDHAYVYWPAGTKWGSAEPRPAHQHEISAILYQALSSWV